MHCSRPDCNAPAAALVVFEPGQRVAHLLSVEAEAGGWSVCRRHAETLATPRGWVLVDDRPDAPALFALPEEPRAARRAAAAVTTSRRPDRDPGGIPLPLEAPAAEPAANDAVVDLDDPAVETVSLWNGHFAPVDAETDLGGVLAARTPLLQRAFRAARAG